MRLSRRGFVVGMSAALPASLASLAWPSRDAFARGRAPLGGRIAMHVPWPLGGVDPHRIDDAAAAIFGDALFDTLYAAGENGAIVPSLAESDPVLDNGALRVIVRSNLKTAHGRAIEARDVAASIGRARALGAKAWLADVPAPKLDGKQTLVFATKDAARLVRALATPLAAIVPLAFRAEAPDGTGPMRAARRGDALVLTRNPNAARGASVLDEIAIGDAKDVLTSLRAFQSGADDVGWLGSGLYEPRKGSVPFDAGAVGWALLRTGKDAGAEWSAPGVAQSICDALPFSPLKGLVLGAEWPSSGGTRTWGGAPCELLVRDDAAWLMELGKTMSGLLSTPSHEITLKPIAAAELAQRRASRAYALALDVARPLATGSLGAYAGLATADDAASAVDAVRHAPRGEMSPRAMTRTMRIGVIGEIRVQGSRMPDVVLPLSSIAPPIDWGAASRASKR